LKQHNKQSWDFDKTKNALEAAEQMDRAETLGGLSEILARASAEISHATYSRWEKTGVQSPWRRNM